MISIRIPGTDDIEESEAARKFLKQHALIRRKDLKRIIRLAEKLNVADAFRALDIKVHALTPAAGGDWEPKKKSKSTKKK